MLQLLNISNIALIDHLRVEFDSGLNLLTGETGSGKSIIVDALGILIGGKFTSEMLKSGTERGFIEGLFSVAVSDQLDQLLGAAGISVRVEEQPPDGSKSARIPRETFDLIVRRELNASGRNKIFINNQLATQSLLRDLRQFLVDIHGQGDQQTLFNPETHLELLDAFAGNASLRGEVADAFRNLSNLHHELNALGQHEAEKLQMVDTLRFQINELERAQLAIGEDENLEEERRRLSNVERLTALCQASYSRIYEDDEAALARIRLTQTDVEELVEFESRFRDHLEGLESARAVLEELAFSLRDFADKLEFSPARLSEIEDRLAELSRLKRKYGGSIEAALDHLARAEDRLRVIETTDERENALRIELEAARARYLDRADELHKERLKAAKKFETEVESGLAEVAMENARFQVQVSDKLQFVDLAVEGSDQGHTTARLAIANYHDKLKNYGPKGIDHVEFYFSANVGEDLKPLARVASGGEASRLMLVLKTVSRALKFPRTIVFDEIDAGIGGRVCEAVGVKLKNLSQTNQVLCVTHQPQIARFADNHLVVQKEAVGSQTAVRVKRLDRAGRVEELARMLTGSEITDKARRHAKELLKR